VPVKLTVLSNEMFPLVQSLTNI